ncbi:nitroreductase family protein [Clostridium nigeriense]|uniref:nitroreductase family protein n=1 Tax=Clostridium nigeriense TaxID=1805470 RepID=UPI003D33FE5D
MDIIEAIKNRHSVRKFTDKKIDENIKKELLEVIDECNREGDLNIQLCTEEPKAFDSLMAHYGKFSNVKNYIAIVGKKGNEFNERCGYYGEKIVLKATQLGLNTCWVALTFSKVNTMCSIEKGEKLCCVIALGYGENQGVAHKSKSMDQLSKINGDMPEWFKNGMEAAMLAPTAMNQQKFQISLEGNKVSIKSLPAFYSKLDLGIVKLHFEIGAGKDNFMWA